MGRFRDSSDDDSAEQGIDISPLIDCVFILLIFFIVTTVFVEETGVEVDKPQAASSVQLEKTSILIALTENIDPAAAESRVKTLLAAEPEAAHLHFTLGNLYAGQERWPEAQQAYFDAFRLDDENADYAFNLAVSLDRLLQRRTALDYYRLALDLATRRPASFDSASVTERIRVMAAAGEG